MTWTFDPWPWPLNFDLEHLQRIICDVMKQCTKFERNRSIRGGVITAISVFDLMTLNIALRVALGSGIIFNVWPSKTYTCLNYSVFMLIRYVTLWPWPLTHWPWYIIRHVRSKSVRNLSEIEQSPAELWVILRIFAYAISHCDLDLWPLAIELLGHIGCHAFKLCTKFELNAIIHGWDIDDLARFRMQF